MAKPKFGMKGKGCAGSIAMGVRVRRIDRDGRQDRKDLVGEMLVQPGPLFRAQLVARQHFEADLAQRPPELVPAGLLAFEQRRDPVVNRGELRGRRQAVRARFGQAGAHLPLEAGHADHGELVQVGRRDRQEAQSLERRVLKVGGLVQHPRVESQPGELPVDEAPGRVRRDLRYRCRLLRVVQKVWPLMVPAADATRSAYLAADSTPDRPDITACPGRRRRRSAGSVR
jgi:hypothetical protein